MNWETIIDPITGARVTLMLLHSIWQVALLAAGAWIIGRVRRRRVESSYAIHVAALLVGLAAMPITYALIHVAPTAAADPRGVVAEVSPQTRSAAQPFAESSNDTEHNAAASNSGPAIVDSSKSSPAAKSFSAIATVLPTKKLSAY